MLQLRPNCECCNRDLPPESEDALICSFECTFCRACATSVLKGVCPNCGGGVGRPPAKARREARQVSAQRSAYSSRRGVQMLPNKALEGGRSASADHLGR